MVYLVKRVNVCIYVCVYSSSVSAHQGVKIALNWVQ